jgi:hypothetical protein
MKNLAINPKIIIKIRIFVKVDGLTNLENGSFGSVVCKYNSVNIELNLYF